MTTRSTLRTGRHCVNALLAGLLLLVISTPVYAVNTSSTATVESLAMPKGSTAFITSTQSHLPSTTPAFVPVNHTGVAPSSVTVSQFNTPSALTTTAPATTAAVQPNAIQNSHPSSITTTPATTTTITNLTNAVDTNQRLDQLQAEVNHLQQQRLNEKINALAQQLADLRTLVEMEGQELLAVNQRLKRLEARQQQPPQMVPARPMSPIIGQPAATTATTGKSHQQILPADSMESIKASAAFHNAMQLVRQKRYSSAIPALEQFIKDYPHSSDVPTAYYWLGRTEAIAGNTQLAKIALNIIVKKYPHSVRRPDAMLQLATIELSSGNSVAAKKWLETVMADYPSTRSATLAKQRLQQIP